MNKMVVVTGATTGTGYCVAQKFAANGYDVCITSRDQARAQEAAARLNAAASAQPEEQENPQEPEPAGENTPQFLQ